MSVSFLAGESSPVPKIPKNFPTEIDDSIALGLDLGIGSCGQAIISDVAHDSSQIRNLPTFPNRISFLGVRAFDIPEIKNDRGGVELKNPKRREKKHLRVTTRRRAWRMWEIRKLFKTHGLLPPDYPTDQKLWKYPPQRGQNPVFDKWRDWHSQMTEGPNGQQGPWQWRVNALDAKLAPLPWAATLLHIAKHRGFKSNRKTAASDDDGGKVIAALKENDARMEQNNYRTIGEMLLKDPEFADKKRNSANSYTSVIYRDDQKKEIELLFENQRSLGNPHASADLEKAYLELFQAQYPLQNPLNLLGDCPFEDGEKRAPRHAYSFELSRALQKINNLKLITPDGQEIRLPVHLPDLQSSYSLFIKSFHTQGTKTNPGRITWKNLREVFNLEDEIEFLDLPTPKAKNNGTFETREDLEKEDFLTRSNANGTAKGSYILHQALGDELWQKHITTSPEQADKISFALTFFEEIKNNHKKPLTWGVINQLRADSIHPDLIKAIHANLTSDSPTLHKFAGTASMSLTATRKLLPILKNGTSYPEACTEIYGDHRQHDFDFQNITNPVVKTVVRECLKQVVHLITETGKIPGRICVELSRDLGKSVNERNEIHRELDKRTKRKNANRKNLQDQLNREPSADELLRYELYLEQTHTCPYCGEQLGRPDEIITRKFEIDHILPRSRSHNNGYDNKVLVHIGCNQNKRNATPFETPHIGNGDENSPTWIEYTNNIRSLKSIRKQKRKNLLNTNFAEKEHEFAARNLNDTRYIAKLVTHYLQEIYVLVGEKRLTEKGSTRRVFVQPGPLTSLVRKAWGLENLKKDLGGQRLGDKHHAIDALICALLSEGQRQFITRRQQEKTDAARKAFSSIAKSYRLMERENDHNRVPRNISPPWKNFRHDVVQALDLFTVSRRENRKGSGSLHKDTLYSIKEENEQPIAYTRKPIIATINGKSKPSLTKAQIENIRGINDERNTWLKKSLTDWITAGSPIEPHLQPKDPQGNTIKRVYLSQGKKTGRQYPQGYVTDGKLIRLDIFSKTNAKNVKTYHLIPVYSYHLKNDLPPNLAIVANKPEDDWTQIDQTYDFEFSLWQNSRVEIKKKPTSKKPDGEHFIGLYKAADRNTGSFKLAAPDDSQEQQQFTAKTGTLLFRKIETDRLGREFIVKKETRTWRGKNV